MVIELIVAGMISNAGYMVAVNDKSAKKKRLKKDRLHPKKVAHRRCRVVNKGPGRTVAVLQDIKTALMSTDNQNLQISMDPELKSAIEERRKSEKNELRLSLAALSVTVSAAFVPVLTGFGVAAILFLSRETFRLIWRDFKRGHYLSFYLVSLALTFGMIAGGHIILAATNSVMFGFFASLANKMEDNADDKLAGIFNQHPTQVWVLEDDLEIQIPFNDLKAGDRVRVNAGEVIAVDGVVQSGLGLVDQHILTGESQPVEKETGNDVFASTLLLSGNLIVQVSVSGKDTVAAKIGQVLDETKSYKDTLMLRGRAIGDRFIPVKLGLATIAFPFLGLNSALAIMWANLGQGVSITGPLTLMSYLQVLSRQQILIKDGRVFETLQDIDTIVFDKTGTLTEEQPTVGRVHHFNGFSEREILTFSAAAEHRQAHPIAKAIVARASNEQIDYPVLEESCYEVGYGIKVVIDDRVIRVGSWRFLEREGISMTAEIEVAVSEAAASGHSLVFVGIEDELAGILELEPTIRPEAYDVVSMLKKRNIEVCIISGDHEIPTRSLAEKLGIDLYFAQTLPENKARHVQELRDKGRFVCFVGDGVNDTIALKTAQVSISLKGASTAATDTAQIIFMDGTLQRLGQLFDLADEFTATMRRAITIGFTPGILTIGGVFFLQFGVLISLSVLYLNMCLGIGNIVWPIVKHQVGRETNKLPHPEADKEIEGGDCQIEKPHSHNNHFNEESR